MQLYQTLLITNGVANIDLKASFAARRVLGKFSTKFMCGKFHNYYDLILFGKIHPFPSNYTKN